ncbi:hypothetical protein TSACC_22681 [Terrimicrobium sacchariphilum]|uniref:Uncharacterized protein n=1 Tax=Terrimicrobium sacchariphilum TaxID=690879 RepID=A0A146GCK8_TERSA|nr:hypothetical protein [Terrimicrobium sacchariphilum]GAT34256.1 hypothetical protein TSACC_22681 [Terrimicrobium sacchariphilum]
MCVFQMSQWPDARSVARTALAIFSAVMLVWTPLQAADTASFDFPIKDSADIPARMAGPVKQIISSDGIGYTIFALQPATPGEEVLATVVFEDGPEGGPALLWIDDSGQQVTLSSSLSDGVEGKNQRTVAIPVASALSGGRLVISGDQSKVLRARLDWLSPVSTVAAADQRPGRYLVNDRLVPVDAVNGQPPVAEPDAWIGKVYEAFLQEEPASVEGGVEFVVPLGEPASQVLLSARFLGLPLDQGVSVWLNKKYIGELHPQVPPLTDAGYVVDESGDSSYAGWRTGSLFIRASDFQQGDNSLVISSRATGAYIRDAALQFRPAASPTPSPGQTVSAGDSVDLDSQNLDLSP